MVQYLKWQRVFQFITPVQKSSTTKYIFYHWFQEHGEARLTDCVYQVSDVDGRISTEAMTFQVDSDRQEDVATFYMVGQTNPANWFVMNMTVAIRSPLNFETTALHIFSVTALVSVLREVFVFPIGEI